MDFLKRNSNNFEEIVGVFKLKMEFSRKKTGFLNKKSDLSWERDLILGIGKKITFTTFQ